MLKDLMNIVVTYLDPVSFERLFLWDSIKYKNTVLVKLQNFYQSHIFEITDNLLQRRYINLIIGVTEITKTDITAKSDLINRIIYDWIFFSIYELCEIYYNINKKIQNIHYTIFYDNLVKTSKIKIFENYESIKKDNWILLFSINSQSSINKRTEIDNIRYIICHDILYLFNILKKVEKIL